MKGGKLRKGGQKKVFVWERKFGGVFSWEKGSLEKDFGPRILGVWGGILKVCAEFNSFKKGTLPSFNYFGMGAKKMFMSFGGETYGL